MRFSLNFIKEFLRVDAPPQKLASLLTMAGMEVERVEKCGADWAFDIEVTTNRYDWLSILGIAREAAACLGRKLKVTYPRFNKSVSSRLGRKIAIENSKDCPFYVGQLITGVTVSAAPAWLSQRLVNCGIKSINNIVDITNYCMLKWGNPLHAFDQDKLQGDIYIRRAKEGESFVGIDDKERVLKKDNLVIADRAGVIALAGVIGGKTTEVDARTKNVFLEAAIFSPLSVRQSRRRAGVETQSSYRFERRVSPECLEAAAAQAARLMEELAAGKLAAMNQAGDNPAVKEKKITVSFTGLDNYLGGSFPKTQVKKVLTDLDFKVKPAGGGICVSPPAFRFDIDREVDVYEEFARIYGYDNIEPKLPFLFNRLGRDALYETKEALRRLLPLFGFKEIVTYSIEDEQDLTALGEDDFIRLVNPLRQQESVLRTSLICGMVKAIRYNLNRRQDGLRFFEAANLYLKDKDGFRETPSFSLGAAGAGSFFHFKGVVEAVLAHFNIKVTFKEKTFVNFTNALGIFAGQRDLGFLGKLDAAAGAQMDLEGELIFCQIDVALLAESSGRKKYKPFSPYPAIWQDVSIGLRGDVKFKEIEDIIKLNSEGYLVDLRVVDVYKGKDLSPGTRAFTLRVFYRSADRTLTSQEITSLHEDIRTRLSQREGVTLR